MPHAQPGGNATPRAAAFFIGTSLAILGSSIGLAVGAGMLWTKRKQVGDALGAVVTSLSNAVNRASHAVRNSQCCKGAAEAEDFPTSAPGTTQGEDDDMPQVPPSVAETDDELTLVSLSVSATTTTTTTTATEAKSD